MPGQSQRHSLQKRVPEESILGLFPALNVIGGVQASGRLAWEGVVERAWPMKAHLFCYGAEAGGGNASLSTTLATSKLKAVMASLRVRQPFRYVLIWHVDLLKLLPFFRIRESKVVLFLHGIEVWHKVGPIDAGLLRRVDLFLSNSDFTWQRFLQDNPVYAEFPHRVVQLGIETPVMEDPEYAANPPVVLMLGRLLRSEDYKGHREMITAWPQVLERVPDAELWIVGDGDLREELARLSSEYGVAGLVRFLGSVSEDEKFDLLSRCRCLALPSRGEGFGLVYLEAMRLGKPCLVSTLDAGREVVNPPEAGLAVNPADINAVAEAVCSLLADTTETRARGRRATRRYESNFTARHFQRRLIAALFDEDRYLNCDV